MRWCKKSVRRIAYWQSNSHPTDSKTVMIRKKEKRETSFHKQSLLSGGLVNVMAIPFKQGSRVKSSIPCGRYTVVMYLGKGSHLHATKLLCGKEGVARWVLWLRPTYLG